MSFLSKRRERERKKRGSDGMSGGQTTGATHRGGVSSIEFMVSLLF